MNWGIKQKLDELQSFRSGSGKRRSDDMDGSEPSEPSEPKVLKVETLDSSLSSYVEEKKKEFENFVKHYNAFEKLSNKEDYNPNHNKFKIFKTSYEDFTLFINSNIDFINGIELLKFGINIKKEDGKTNVEQLQENMFKHFVNISGKVVGSLPIEADDTNILEFDNIILFWETMYNNLPYEQKYQIMSSIVYKYYNHRVGLFPHINMRVQPSENIKKKLLSPARAANISRSPPEARAIKMDVDASSFSEIPSSSDSLHEKKPKVVIRDERYEFIGPTPGQINDDTETEEQREYWENVLKNRHKRSEEVKEQRDSGIGITVYDFSVKSLEGTKFYDHISSSSGLQSLVEILCFLNDTFIHSRNDVSKLNERSHYFDRNKIAREMNETVGKIHIEEQNGRLFSGVRKNLEEDFQTEESQSEETSNKNDVINACMFITYKFTTDNNKIKDSLSVWYDFLVSKKENVEYLKHIPRTRFFDFFEDVESLQTYITLDISLINDYMNGIFKNIILSKGCKLLNELCDENLNNDMDGDKYIEEISEILNNYGIDFKKEGGNITIKPISGNYSSPYKSPIKKSELDKPIISPTIADVAKRFSAELKFK